MDNLSAHHCVLVQQTVMADGQRLIFRPKYSPADAPIEYVFNTLQAELRIRMREINQDNLVDMIRNIIANMNGFHTYITHCGYAE
jgi:transposase